MAIIITVSNQKGGVGKTTTSAALISGLTLAGMRVLGVDFDPQGNLGFCLGLESQNGPGALEALKGDMSVHEAASSTPYGDILSSDIMLSNGLDQVAAEHRELILTNVLDSVKDEYDYVVIDTPPALNLLTVNAYTASDYLIIPMSSDILSLVGLSQLTETIETVRSTVNPRLNVLGILLTRFNPRTLLSRDVLEMAQQLANQIDTRVFDTKIRAGVAVAEAPAHGESIFDYNPRSGAVGDYQDFIREVMEIIHSKER